MTFKAGTPKPPGSGRKRGVPNKVTRDLAEAVLQAFDKVGGVEYLVKLADKEPRVFGTLMAKVMPTQLTGSNGKPIQFQDVTDEVVLGRLLALGESVRAIGAPPPPIPQSPDPAVLQ